MTRKKLTYHWLIVFAVFMLMAITIGIPVNCFSVFAPAWVDYYERSTTVIQLVNMTATFATVIGCIFYAKVLEKIGFRKAIVIYSILTVVGLALRSTARSIPMLILYSVIMAFGISGCSTIPGSLLINNWFHKDRGTATGIAFTGSVAGGLVFVQLSKFWIASSDWQTANLYLSIIALVCLLPLALFVLKEKPSDLNMLPYGVSDENIGEKPNNPIISGISKKDFFKTGVFRLFALVFFLIGFCNMGVQNNTTLALVNQNNFDAVQAANIFSVVMFVQIFGKPLLGKIYDKAGIKFASVYNIILFLGSVLTIILATNITVGIIFGCVFGLMCSMTTVTPPYILASSVGTRDYAAIYGVLNLIFVLGAAFGPIAVSSFYDSTGSYTGIFIILAALSLIGGILTIVSTGRAKKLGFSEK